MNEVNVKWLHPVPKPTEYGFHSNFSWAYDDPDDKNGFIQASVWGGCRDWLIERMRTAYLMKHRGIDSLLHQGTKVQPTTIMNSKKMFPALHKSVRLMIGTTHSKPQAFYEKIEVAAQALNKIENYYNWSPTQVFKTQCESNPKLLTAIFAGPIEWMRCPQLLSLYALVIRSGGPATYELINRLLGYEHKVSNEFKTSDWEVLDALIRRDRLKLVLDNLDELFFCRSITDNFILQTYGDGISNLILNRTSASTEITRVIQKLIKKVAA